MPDINQADLTMLARLLLQQGQTNAASVKSNPLWHGKPFIVLNDMHSDGATEQRLVFLDQEQAVQPERRGEIKLLDASSFVEFFKTFGDEHSRIYAQLDPACITGVLDEHPPAKGSGARWREHRCHYAPKFSRQWLAWAAQDGSAFAGNVEFAEWIEEQLGDFDYPDGAWMQEMALNFRVGVQRSYVNAARLDNGQVNLMYKSEVSSGSTVDAGEVRIPEKFGISIPIFEGPTAPNLTINARLRYRLSGGALKIWYKLEDPLRRVETAFFEIVGSVADQTDCTVLYGVP